MNDKTKGRERREKIAFNNYVPKGGIILRRVKKNKNKKKRGGELMTSAIVRR